MISVMLLYIGIFILSFGIFKIIKQKKKKSSLVSSFKIIRISIFLINISYIIYSLLSRNGLFMYGIIILICINICEYACIKRILNVYNK